MILTADELAGLTERTRTAAQARVLSHLGVPFRRRDNALVVWRRDVMTALGYTPPDVVAKPAGPSNADLWARYAEGGIEHRTFARGDRLPRVMCIYLMLDEGRAHYIGQTVDLPYRMKQHTHQWWRSLVVIEYPEWWPYERRSFWLNAMETMAIEQFAPTENRAIVGCGYSVPAIAALFTKLPPEWVCPKS